MTGSLQTKNNQYYIVLNTYENGKRKQKWINTELPVKGNKTKAQKLLRETLEDYEKAEELRAQQEADRANIPFVDAIKLWYSEKTADFEHPIDEVTKQGYETLMKNHVFPYWEKKGFLLREINKNNLQDYINEKAKNGRLDGKGGLAPRSLKLLKNIVNQTLLYCVSEGMIPNNPCQFVKLPACEEVAPCPAPQPTELPSPLLACTRACLGDSQAVGGGRLDEGVWAWGQHPAPGFTCPPSSTETGALCQSPTQGAGFSAPGASTACGVDRLLLSLSLLLSFST